MFHLILAACLASAPTNCGIILLPQGDAATQQACEAGAARIAQEWLEAHPELVGDAPACPANVDLPAADLQEVAPGVHVNLGTSLQMEDSTDGHIANLGAVIGRDTVAVIDAGVSRAEGQALYTAIRRITDKPISHLIVTHMHPDHSFGAAVFAEAGAVVLGHHALPQALEGRGAAYLANLTQLYPPAEWIGTEIVLPDRVVGDRMQIDLGDRILELRAWPPAHTDNDLTVFDRQTATLFAGDLLFRELTPVVDGSLRGWLEWLDSDPAAGARFIVPGHGAVTGSWAEASGPQRIFLEALAGETRKAIDAGQPMSSAVPEITKALEPLKKDWASFEATVARDATVAFQELEWE
ncbi:quinoprotein relay system zinc metallohydrolase 2 [Paracoccus beibuensis]|uniref:quinoprotein relay system zinc metallohydrolase 2 n=1 Tax=Paracoccus beibuensis TaxID=547602 RepID=UPI00223F82FF|nr:quinoprotein relay system zinc metallohydrolase 2 [Paracoccus beibuensis]